MSEQKLKNVPGYLLENDVEVWLEVQLIVGGSVATTSLETSSPAQEDELIDLLQYQQVVQEDASIPGLAEEVCAELPDS